MSIASFSFLCFCFIQLTFSLPDDALKITKFALLLEKHVDIKNCNTPFKPLACPPSKFRTPDGICNNAQNPRWGSAGDAFLRIIPPNYSDEKSKPRKSINNKKPLPNPKNLVHFLENVDLPFKRNSDLSSLFALWGQLIGNDISKIYALENDKNCCIEETFDESVCYTYHDGACKNYKRTTPSRHNETCSFDVREQMNGVSSFFDGSDLYGDSFLSENSIRTFTNGKVVLEKCEKCKNTPLSMLYKALLQEHNRVADMLINIYPSLNDNEIFHQTKKIVIAEMQHITINEFVPILLGQETSNLLNLTPVKGKYFNKYSRKNRPGTFTEAAVSAFPIFNNMIPEYINIDTLSRPITFYMNLTNNTWDSLELMIHRSREHGIAPYNKYKEACQEFLKIFTESDFNYKLLDKQYGDYNDIDLIVGSILEKSQLGAVFGPTLTCIFAQQFIKMRNSDRFWFENDIPPSSINLNVLKSIQDVTLSSLLCSSGLVNEIPPRSFYTPDEFLNAPIACNSTVHLNLEQIHQTDTNENAAKINIKTDNFPYSLKESITENELDEALKAAKDKLIERKKKEYELWLINGGIDARSPEGTAASFSKANRNALSIANSSLFYEIASNEILNHFRRNRRKRQTFDEFSSNLQFIDVNSAVSGSISPITMEPQCEDFSAPCDTKTPFRTLTGHCNNLKNPSLGRSLTTFARLLPAVYEDGISLPRSTSVTGQQLPNPRTISSLIHPDISNLHTRYSLITMQFAQFLDHDLTMTPIHKGFHESIPSCRSCNSAETVHPECNPIPIPPNDFFFPELNITDGSQFCFPFMRSLPGQQTLGPREQINQNTAFVDASQVYGENACICRKLRGFSGRLNSTSHPVRGKELLPQSPSHPECKAPSGYCFIAGDGRASEQPGLTVIHTLFMREHNRIVEGLRGVNPHWNGEQLFDHARRINVAINQHIVYNEFLPRVLSWNAVNLYGLKLLPTGYYKDFNPSCNPAIVTEFAAAAFRIGHSLLRPHIPRLSPQHQPIDPPILLRDGFFKVDMILQPGMVDEISRGLVATPMETLDQFITGEVTNHLFEDRRIPFSGIDLIALNIQRARDHGIPSYNNYRALCNLKRAQSWDDLNREIPPEVITRLKRIYASVDDIDLFPGGMSERPLQGGLVGPTFACIIAIQFRQLRKCDRFWYETDNPNLRFTETQLAEIRKITLSKVICENLDEPGDIQRAAFDLPSNFLNPRVPCQSLPQIDLNAWRENLQGCQVGGRNIKVGESAFPTPCTSCICSKDGLQCASLRITDCGALAREWSRESILKDEICYSQCSQTFSQANLRQPVQRSVPRSTF